MSVYVLVHHLNNSSTRKGIKQNPRFNATIVVQNSGRSAFAIPKTVGSAQPFCPKTHLLLFIHYSQILIPFPTRGRWTVYCVSHPSSAEIWKDEFMPRRRLIFTNDDRQWRCCVEAAGSTSGTWLKQTDVGQLLAWGLGRNIKHLCSTFGTLTRPMWLPDGKRTCLWTLSGDAFLFRSSVASYSHNSPCLYVLSKLFAHTVFAETERKKLVKHLMIIFSWAIEGHVSLLVKYKSFSYVVFLWRWAAK